MRFVKLFLVLALAVASRLGMAQVSEEPAISAERDPQKSVHLYPLPVIDYLTVKLEDIPADKVTLTLHTIIGNQIEIETEVISETELRVRLKELSSGYYLLAIKDSQTNKVKYIQKVLKR
jgi:hypothetical protein